MLKVVLLIFIIAGGFKIYDWINTKKDGSLWDFIVAITIIILMLILEAEFIIGWENLID